MKKISSRSRLVPEMIRDCQTFATYGALTADRVSPGSHHHHSSGMLDSAERERFFATRDIDYIVYSYATPIAWHSESKGWHKVAQRFSVTTGKHQGKLYLIG
jgi:hypothetical protein